MTRYPITDAAKLKRRTLRYTLTPHARTGSLRGRDVRQRVLWQWISEHPGVPVIGVVDYGLRTWDRQSERLGTLTEVVWHVTLVVRGPDGQPAYH